MKSQRALGCGAAVFLLTGCLSAPPAPAEHFYRLVAGEPVTRLPVTLQVQQITADGLLRERALLFSDDDGHRVLKQHAYHYWADAPARLLQDYLIAQLHGSNPLAAGRLHAADYALDGRVVRMERLLADRRVDVALSLEFEVRRRADGGRVMQRRYDLVEPAKSDRVVDSIKAFESALERVLARLAADLAAAFSHADMDYGRSGPAW